MLKPTPSSIGPCCCVVFRSALPIRCACRSLVRVPYSEAHLAERHGFYGKLTDTHADGGPIGVWRLGMADYNGYSRAGPQMIEAVKEGFIVHLEDILQVRDAIHEPPQNGRSLINMGNVLREQPIRDVPPLLPALPHAPRSAPSHSLPSACLA